MISESKIYAPKPIRKGVSLPVLKNIRSIGYTSKNKNKNIFSDFKNSKYSNEITKKPSISPFPDYLSKKLENEFINNNIISYEEFQNEINNNIIKQSATTEILSILSNCEKSNLDASDINLDRNSNFKSLNNSRNKISDACINQKNKTHKRFGKTQKQSEKFLPEKRCLTSKNENSLFSKFLKNENLDLKNNFLLNSENLNTNNEKNCYKTNSSIIYYSDEKESIEHIEFLKDVKIMHGQMEDGKNLKNPENDNFIVNNKIEVQNLEKSLTKKEDPKFIIDSFEYSNNIQKNNYFHHSDNRNKTNDLEKKKLEEEENKIMSIEIKNKINQEKENNKEDKFEFSYFDFNQNNNFLNDLNFSNNILYFFNENFFFDLENDYQQIEDWNENKYAISNNYKNIDLIKQRIILNQIPIRCENPFEKSLSIEGCKKLRQFFNEEIEINNRNLKSENIKKFNHQPEYIENF